MSRIKYEIENESRSEKIRELLKKEPPYFIRYGTTLILFILLLIAGLFTLIR